MPSLGRWSDLCASLEATRLIDATYQRLVACYAEPHRSYHNARHIEHCLGLFDLVRDGSEHPALTEAAIWFHDAIYDTHASDNEEASANLAALLLTQMGVAPSSVRAVAALILFTRHDTRPETIDGRIVVDVDLAILGASPAEFDAYESGIRAEYDWVPEQEFAAKRCAILQAFLARDRLFCTDHFSQKFETQVRANLARSIERLKSAESRADPDE